MQRLILKGAGVFAVANACYMWVATRHWYNSVPGVQQTGALNGHFAGDVALAFMVSGAALIWAGVRRDSSAGACGAAWLVGHAVGHFGIWAQRGFPVDAVAATNLAGIQLPAVLALWAVLTLHRSDAR